jgi:D-alanyl-D-alanine carboxypeptidase
MQPVNTILKQEVEAKRTPSLQYRFFDTNTIIHRFNYGYAHVANQQKTDTQTTYNAYSVTKTFTALAVLQLAEQNKLQLDAPARNYFPDFPYTPDITIRNLLTHTAGIPNPIPLNWIHLASEHASFDSRQFFNAVFSRHNKTRSKPNEKFAYSNLGYVLLGQVIENVTGLTYEQYICTNILNRLGLAADALGFEIADAGRHATGYHKSLSFSNALLGFLIDKHKYMDKSQGAWKPFKPFYVNGAAYGGLIGTADAFVTYLQALLTPNAPVLPDTYKQMLFTENGLNTNKPSGMCLSWFTGQLKGNRYFRHAGGGGGYYCEIRVYPDLGLGSVIMFNRTGMRDERFLDTIDAYIVNKRMTNK